MSKPNVVLLLSDDRTNIAAQNPEKVQELSSSLEEWLKATPSMVVK